MAYVIETQSAGSIPARAIKGKKERRKEGKKAMLAIILTIALAQPSEALPVEQYQSHDADTAVGAVVRLPYGALIEGSIRAADFDDSKRVVVAWKKGKADDALKAIEVSGLKLEEKIEPLRIAICTGKLTDESLKSLRSDPAIASVEPDNDLQPQLFLPAAPPPEALPVERYQWHDADTAVGAVVRLPYGVLIEGAIRAADYDAWEIGSRTGQSVDDAERIRGRKALEELRTLTDGGRLYIVPVPPGTRDSFGRLLGRFYVRRPSGEVVDVRQWAVANGHTRKGR